MRILNFFWPKSNPYMPFVNFRKTFCFFSVDFRQNFDVRTFPRWLSIRGTKFFLRDIQKNFFFKIFTLVLSDRFLDFSEFCGHRPFYFSIFKYETVDNNRKGEKLQDVQYTIELKQIYSIKHYSCHMCLFKDIEITVWQTSSNQGWNIAGKIYSAIEERIIRANL